MVVPSWNFNQHLELDDTSFAEATVYVLSGGAAGAPMAEEVAYIGQSGRYAWYTSRVAALIQNHLPADGNNLWFQMVPSWAPVAAIVISGLILTIGTLLAVSKRVKRPGNGSEEY